MDKNLISRNVFDEALRILENESTWQKQIEFGETCDPNATKLSLGCAMEKAMETVIGAYKNRGREMGSLRWRIYLHFFWRAGIHPVTYFNRHKKTKHKDILYVLKKARKKFE